MSSCLLGWIFREHSHQCCVFCWCTFLFTGQSAKTCKTIDSSAQYNPSLLPSKLFVTVRLLPASFLPGQLPLNTKSLHEASGPWKSTHCATYSNTVTCQQTDTSDLHVNEHPKLLCSTVCLVDQKLDIIRSLN